MVWISNEEFTHVDILGSIVVSIPACHAGDRGSIPCRGETIFQSYGGDSKLIGKSSGSVVYPTNRLTRLNVPG